MSVFIVLDDRQDLDICSGRAQNGGDHRSVRLVDLPGGKRLPGRAQLASSCENRAARPNGALNFGDPGRSERTDMSGGEARADAHNDVTLTNVSAARSNVLTAVHMLENLDAIAVIDGVLDRDYGVSLLGHRGARRNPGCRSRRKRLRCRAARRDSEGDRKLSRSLGGAYGEAVHRRARKRREGDSRQGRFPKYPTGGVRNRDALQGKQLRSLPNTCESLFDRQ